MTTTATPPAVDAPEPGASPAPRTEHPWWSRATGPVLLVFVLGALIVWRGSFTFRGERYFTLFDDAMVSMRYARNLADGHGLLWNVGQTPVEGYTNLLWTLWMALVHALGVPPRLAGAVVGASGVACVAATVVLAGRIARRIAPDRIEVPAVTMWLTACWYPLLWWSARGLEPGLIAALTAALVLLALRVDAGDPPRHPLVGAVALVAAGLLTRTDFLVVVVVVVAWLARRAGRGRVLALQSALAAVAVLALHTAFRLAYYGEALPNTYTLKVEGIPLVDRLSRGSEAFAALVVAELAVVVVLAGVGLWWTTRERRSAPGGWLLLGVFAAAVVYSVGVGGDAWEYAQYDNRYVAPAVPLLLVLVAIGIEHVARQRGRARGTLVVLGGTVVVGVLAAMVDAWWGSDDQAIRAAWKLTSQRRDQWLALAVLVVLVAVAALAIRAGARARVAVLALAAAVVMAGALPAWMHWSRTRGDLVSIHVREARRGLRLHEAANRPDATFAVVAAGNLPYWSELPAVDLLGKSDPVIARHAPRRSFVPGHDKWDYAYSICELQPDVVAQLWLPTRREIEAIEACGYTRIFASWFEREGQTGFDPQRLRAAIFRDL